MASERRNKSEAEWRPPPPFPKQHQRGPGLESKLALPEQLAPAYVFLASNADSSFITGTILQVMGGETTGG